jgi:hypothetical protein
LYYAFHHKDDKSNIIHREQAHVNTIQKFLVGYTDRTPADILTSWLHLSDGRLDNDSELMYSFVTLYTDIVLPQLWFLVVYSCSCSWFWA